MFRRLENEHGKEENVKMLENAEALMRQMEVLKSWLRETEKEGKKVQQQKEGEVSRMKMEAELPQQQIEQLTNRVNILEHKREESIKIYLSLLNAKNLLKKQTGEGD